MKNRNAIYHRNFVFDGSLKALETTFEISFVPPSFDETKL